METMPGFFYLKNPVSIQKCR